MRVKVKVKSFRTASTKPRKAPPVRQVPACIEPECPDPLGGLVRTGRLTPMRIWGRCSRCFQRRLRVVRAAKAGKIMLPCADRECADPVGGLVKPGGKRPARIGGYCRTCYNRRMRRWERDRIKKKKAR